MGKKKADRGKDELKTSLSLLSVNATHVLDTCIQLVLDK